MTIAVDLGRKATKQTNKQTIILICTLAQVYVLLLTRFTFFKYSFDKCLRLLLLCMLPNDKLIILSICIAVVDINMSLPPPCIKSVKVFRKFIRLK